MKEKIKRISSSTWALILALMMVVSSFSVLAATTNVEKTGSGYSAGDTIYFSAGSTSWYDGDARTVAYFYSNSSDGCYAVFQSAGNDKNYLKATVPTGTFTTMILIRYDPKTSTFNTNGGVGWPGDAGLWNRIDNITRSDSSNNLYTVTSDSLNAGTWSKYSASDPVATSVSLNADNDTINVGDSLKLTASTTGKVAGDVKYTFYQNGTKIDEKTTSSESVETTVSNLSSGTYKYTVTVSKNNYSDVTSSEVSVTVKSIPTNKWYIYGGLNKDDWNNKKGISMSWSTTENAYVSDVTFNKVTYFRLYDGSYVYGPKEDGNGKDIVISTGKTENQIHKGYDSKAFIVPSDITSTYYICTDGKYVWYKVAQPNVAKSVNLTANPENVVVGGSTTLTATLDTPNTDNVTYTFTEDGK